MAKTIVIPADPSRKAFVAQTVGLVDLQALVGGYIELAPLGFNREDVCAYVNEDARRLDMKHNPRADKITRLGYPAIAGTLILVGVDPMNGADTLDAPDDLIQELTTP